jgi:hypothetical protein
MSRKQAVHDHLAQAASEILAHIGESEPAFADRWVPARKVKSDLGLRMVSYPRSNKINNETGWLFATLMRLLEDQGAVEFRKEGSRSFYRVKRA